MRGLVKYDKGVGFVGVRDVDMPSIHHPDEVLIKIKACGLCATDVHVWKDEFRSFPPVVLGHEFSGEIVDIGGNVKEFKIGDRVVAEPKTGSCGSCSVCREGKIQLCKHRKAPGWGINGGMTDYIVMPFNMLHIIPDKVDYDVAALCEPLSIVVHEVTERAGVQCSDVVLVIGSGSIGILSAFVAKSCGASKVIITGLNASESVRFPVAQSLGADEVINVEKDDVVKRVMEITNGKGADLIIESSGSTQGIINMPAMARIGGRITCIGLCKTDNASLLWNTAMYKALNLYFNFSSSYSAWDKALKLMETTEKNLRYMITNYESIDNWEKIFSSHYDENAVKVMFIPEDEICAYH
ncbi:MAG: alcohol dehydrogenase catalytic domain-containing protein [Eubacteriales bacterium]|nr:alcohol dehydrogenase catalytic domain-containing protein [Eubacteriales bacterium]